MYANSYAWSKVYLQQKILAICGTTCSHFQGESLKVDRG